VTTQSSLVDDQLPPLLRTLRDSFGVMDMATAELWGPDPTMSIGEARRRMREQHFDVAPLMPRPVRYFVELATLEAIDDDRRPVRDVAEVIDASRLVGADLSLFDAIRAMRDRRTYFVIALDQITAIVAPADLQKATVGLSLLGVIIGCEPLLDTLIRRSYGDDWPAKLTEARMEKVLELFDVRRGHNDDMGLLDCLNLDDRLKLVSKHAALRKELGFSCGSFERWSERMKRARDALAHAGDILSAEADSPSAVDFFESLYAFATRLSATADGGSPGLQR
jgi:hypothetical protein